MTISRDTIGAGHAGQDDEHPLADLFRWLEAVDVPSPPYVTAAGVSSMTFVSMRYVQRAVVRSWSEGVSQTSRATTDTAQIIRTRHALSAVGWANDIILLDIEAAFGARKRERERTGSRQQTAQLGEGVVLVRPFLRLRGQWKRRLFAVLPDGLALATGLPPLDNQSRPLGLCVCRSHDAHLHTALVRPHALLHMDAYAASLPMRRPRAR